MRLKKVKLVKPAEATDDYPVVAGASSSSSAGENVGHPDFVKNGDCEAPAAAAAATEADGEHQKTEAQSWDIHQLYEYSVQSPQADAEFLEIAFGDQYRRSPHTIREDFCGTATTACEWIKLSPQNRAFGIDIDVETVEWGRQNNIANMTEEEQSRIHLVEGDVLDGLPDGEKVDVIAAHNFSWMLFQNRRRLREYFKACRGALNKEGCMVLDIYGGPDAQTVCSESTEHKEKGFTYHWDQESFDAITNVARCNIHFSFPDGTRMDKAFSYEWRLWSLPELRDILLGVNFAKVQVYWEMEDKLEYDGNYGEFAPVRSAENDNSWIAYVVAYRS